MSNASPLDDVLERPSSAVSSAMAIQATSAHRIAGRPAPVTPLAAAMRVIGGRWKLLVIWHLHHGTNTVKELRTAITGISPKMLYQQLRELEGDAVLVRFNDGRRVGYRLTDLGLSLVPHLQSLAIWSVKQNMTERAFRRKPVPE